MMYLQAIFVPNFRTKGNRKLRPFLTRLHLEEALGGSNSRMLVLGKRRMGESRALQDSSAPASYPARSELLDGYLIRYRTKQIKSVAAVLN